MITIKKQYQQTTGLIQILNNNNIQLLLIGVIVSEKFCFRKCVCCLQVCRAWKTISCKTDKVNRVKHSQFSQDTGVEDAQIVHLYKLNEERSVVVEND